MKFLLLYLKANQRQSEYNLELLQYILYIVVYPTYNKLEIMYIL